MTEMTHTPRTQEDWAKTDRESINEYAAPRDLAIVTFRAQSSVYFGVDTDYRREMLREIRDVADAQVEAATDLGLESDADNYAAVREVAREFQDILTPGLEVREANDETRAAYERLMKRHARTKDPQSLAQNKLLEDLTRSALYFNERFTGRLQNLIEPEAHIADFKSTLKKLNHVAEQALALREQRDLADGNPVDTTS